MKLGTKIVLEMLITKIIILAANLTSGVRYRPANFQKTDAGTGRATPRAFFILTHFQKKVVYIVLRYVEFEYAIRL